MMRKCLSVSFFVLLVLPFVIAQQTAFAAGKVVATVGDAKITSADLDELLDHYVPAGSFHSSARISQREKYRGDALNELIEIELLYKEAQKRKAVVADADVEKVVGLNVKNFGSEAKLETALKRQGLTMQTLRDRIRKHQMVLQVLKGLSEASVLMDEDLRAYYEANKAKFRRPDTMRLYHIFVKAEPTDPEAVWQEKQKTAEALLAKIKAGEDFGDVAYKHSDGPYRFKRGDMGLVHKGQVTPPDLEEAAFALKEGELSGVIRTIYGFHILKAGEKKPAETLPFDEVRERLKKELEQKRFDVAKKELLEGLRKEYPVEVLISPPPKDGDSGESEQKEAH